MPACGVPPGKPLRPPCKALLARRSPRGPREAGGEELTSQAVVQPQLSKERPGLFHGPRRAGADGSCRHDGAHASAVRAVSARSRTVAERTGRGSREASERASEQSTQPFEHRGRKSNPIVSSKDGLQQGSPSLEEMPCHRHADAECKSVSPCVLWSSSRPVPAQ